MKTYIIVISVDGIHMLIGFTIFAYIIFIFVIPIFTFFIGFHFFTLSSFFSEADLMWNSRSPDHNAMPSYPHGTQIDISSCSYSILLQLYQCSDYTELELQLKLN